MSQAFVRDGEDQSLDEIAPTLQALIHFLTRENNGIRVYLKNIRMDGGQQVHEMSNGLSYAKDESGKWRIF